LLDAAGFITATPSKGGKNEDHSRDNRRKDNKFCKDGTSLWDDDDRPGPGIVLADPIEKKGTTPYVTHFIFRPVQSLDVPNLGTATLLEAIGTTQNMKGEKMLDKMSARCTALSVDSGSKKYIDGACVLADADGDKIFSTFDTRDIDKSQPNMNCGTHIITGGTGKYAGITGSEPFACNAMPALAGAGGYTAMDIPHNTTWEIK
jgi:hypothetical protein